MASDVQTPTTPPKRKEPDEIKIVSHSSLFYWWPVWFLGFVMGIISLFSGYRIATVPDGTKAGTVQSETKVQWAAQVDKKDGRDYAGRELKKGDWVLVAPEGKKLEDPGVTVSTSSHMGVFFAIVLLIVITITNIHMRGLWSLVVVVSIVSLVVILALIPGAWETIFRYFSILDIRISTGGYFFISGVLFIIWVIVFFLFDPQRYMIFSPGEFKVRLEIGEGETSYDTRGMTVKKERSDFFRHWILGFGSGDLVVKTTGADAHVFHLENVLAVGHKVKVIQNVTRMIRETEA